jgi:NADH dehydrogenase FAD-containing subunit
MVVLGRGFGGVATVRHLERLQNDTIDAGTIVLTAGIVPSAVASAIPSGLQDRRFNPEASTHVGLFTTDYRARQQEN